MSFQIEYIIKIIIKYMKYIKTFESFSPESGSVTPELQSVKSQFPEIFSEIEKAVVTKSPEQLASELESVKSEFGLTDADLKDPKKVIQKLSENPELVEKLQNKYSKELRKEEKLFEKFRKNKEFKKFVDEPQQILFPKGKTRKFTYTTVPGTNDTSQKAEILALYTKKTNILEF